MRFLSILLIAAMMLSSCSRDDEVVSTSDSSMYELTSPSSLGERFSYAFGYLLASSAEREYGHDADLSYIVRGAMDYAEGRAQMSAGEMNQAVIEFQQMQAESNAERTAEKAAENAAAASSFLEANKKRSVVGVTPSGLQYEVVEEGDGKLAKHAEDVEVDYQLTLLDGSIADSSYERGRSSRFSLSSVIPGFAEGIRLMREGSSYRFWIPPELGYGELGAGDSIEPNSLLIFDVHLIEVLD